MIWSGPNRRRMLIVDDDATDRFMIDRLARSCGYLTKAVTNVGELGEINERWMPEIIVLDVLMPPPDGIEILRDLAEMDCPVPVLLVSSHRQILQFAHNLGLGYRVRIAGSLAKPLDAAQFATLLRDTFRAD